MDDIYYFMTSLTFQDSGFEPVCSPLHALFKRYLRVVPDQFSSFIDVCTGAWDIARLHGHDVDHGLLARAFSGDVDESLQRDGPTIPQIVDLTTVRVVDGPNDAANNIVDVCVIALRGPIAKLIDGFSAKNALNKHERCHVRTPTGSIDGEKTQARRRHVIQMGVRSRHQLARFLRCGVG